MPLLQAITAGKVQLARPECSRQPKHRNLQVKVMKGMEQLSIWVS